jgi:hypothetical protein
MGVWIRMHQKLFSVRSRRNERTLDVNLIRVLAGDGRKGIAKGGDVMLNVIYVAEVEGGDLLPSRELALTVMAALLEKFPAEGFVVLDFGDLTSGSNCPSIKVRMLSSVPSFVIKSCQYLFNCCSTEVMLSSM